MSHTLRSMAVTAACMLCASAAAAQSPSPSSTSSQSPSSPSTQSTRPATTTFFGDTGFWFVPTAEIVPHRRVSGSGYRANWDYRQGLTDVSHFAVTGAGGVRDRVELFGSFRVDTRIDHDRAPHFGIDAVHGGLVNDYPYVRRGWTGDHVGDLLVGVKVNLLSQGRQQPVALAVRGLVKIATGDAESGAGTGAMDTLLDLIISREFSRAVEVSAMAGGLWRGDPDRPVAVDLSNGLTWGLGAGFPSRSRLRATTELHGERRFSSTLTASAPLTSLSDSSLAPLVSEVAHLTKATVGLTYQARNGFFVGYGLNYSWPTADVATIPNSDPNKNFWGHQVRLGYHPGVRIYVPPPPAPPPPAPAPAPAPDHTLAVTAACNPCTVQVGQPSTVTAIVQDSIGCAVTYRWSAPTGTFANAAQRQTVWTAPQQEGVVPVTVTVVCPTDTKTAAASVNITVTRPVVRSYTFEDVHFDFDRYSLRPEATRVLDEAVNALQQDPTLRLTVEGHTCNIGTAEYNLALGERRSSSVREYLVSRGIAAARLQTVSYGEERPKYDNEREETRRLNRRAAMVVRLQ